MIWWFEHRMTMAAVAFQVEHLVVGNHIDMLEWMACSTTH